MNLFILVASSVTGDSGKGDTLFLFGDYHFLGQNNTISDGIDHYFMATFTQFWLKTSINIKPWHTSKSSTAHSLGNTTITSSRKVSNQKDDLILSFHETISCIRITVKTVLTHVITI